MLNEKSLEERIIRLEDRVRILEQRHVLTPNIRVSENIRKWFLIHKFLSTSQFTAEMCYMDSTYHDATIRQAISRAFHSGYLVRVKEGLYTQK